MMECEGKVVAIVGRSGRLAGSGLGQEIDSAEVVVRVNWTLPYRAELIPDVGARTDLLYTHQTTGSRELHRRATENGARAQTVNMKLREELSNRLASQRFNYIPNSGTVAIFDALRSGAKEVRAYGFSLHTDGTYIDTGRTHNNRTKWADSRSRGRRAIGAKTHDPERDRSLLKALLEAEPRFRPDAILREIILTEYTPIVDENAIKAIVTKWREEEAVMRQYDGRLADMLKLHANEIADALDRGKG